MVTKSQLAKLGLFDARVPRYTSYPTAPHFSKAIGGAVFADWLERIPERSNVSFYIHVPFCRRLCWFCACRTQGTQSDAPVAAYVETLKSELALLSTHLPAGVKISRLHWGGGTPTLLKAGMIRDLAGAVADVAPFADEYDFSVEIDPNEIDTARLEALAEAGMTRASIGVQDFDPMIQETIGRLQSYDVTRDVADMIRGCGIHSLNTDILYGLPHQTKARMTESVQKLVSLNPDRVALYGYAHVPWMARRQAMIPSDALPTPEERLALFDTARRLFLWDGYDEIGIDHFARPEDSMARVQKAGQLRRNFQGYTDDPCDVLIGLGASSISRFPQGYVQNAAATSVHTAYIRRGEFSSERGHVFAGDDLLRGRMIEALMCDFRIDTDEMMSRFDVPRRAVDQILDDADQAFAGLLSRTKDGLFVPHEARPLTRMIARQLDAYALSKAGHSSAV
ncbi:oxygen-independent coproporphyrinogen III oxidase [Thalassococcus sp. S3]|uniref:oxygen-independent coproporphyrinogen III oxidase n=1 Tax=Thalassococcus sp. S3 TaxID=2017482 RepID=UPI001023FC78|nr:oxygen-independent coproporphyrinogen III oxidase [Thalassococcus sp. S3]QBF33483.1 oxygen-independent coproporphyrinogen III oxidase [Thalassococcus sp. S3]